jgi:hypothetical protein
MEQDAEAPSTEHTTTDIMKASEAACQYVQSCGSAGSSSYPSKFHSYEGFEFLSRFRWSTLPVSHSGIQEDL